MPALTAGRVVRTVVLGAGALLVALVTDATPAAAHAAGGGTLPVPPWLLSYLGVAVVVLTATAVRAGWTPTAAPTPADTGVADAAPIGVGNVIGLVLFALTVLAAIVGPDSGAANIAPVAVLVIWWVGLVVASLVAGDVMRAVNPFAPIVALLEQRNDKRDEREGRPPAWTAAVFLGVFVWYFVAYHRPGSPRALAVLLLVYAGAAVVGGLRWGRGWLATGEAFGAVSAAVARLAPWRRATPAPPALAALMIVWLGAIAFDAFTVTPFWADVGGASQGWTRTLLSTVGLVWLTAIVAGIYLGVLRLADRADPEAGLASRLTAPLGMALVPLAVGWFLAHDLTLVLFEGQNFVALLSDPIGRGWDLFGTIDRTIDYGIVQATWVRWAQVVLLAAGHVSAVVAAHVVASRLVTARTAMRATWAMTAAASTSIVAATLLVLG